MVSTTSLLIPLSSSAPISLTSAFVPSRMGKLGLGTHPTVQPDPSYPPTLLVPLAFHLQLHMYAQQDRFTNQQRWRRGPLDYWTLGMCVLQSPRPIFVKQKNQATARSGTGARRSCCGRNLSPLPPNVHQLSYQCQRFGSCLARGLVYSPPLASVHHRVSCRNRRQYEVPNLHLLCSNAALFSSAISSPT